MRVDVALLIPVKRFGAAKGRLRGVLADEDRARLAEWMATRVLGATAELPVFVACDDEEVRAWAESRGAEVLWGPDLGLNGAVDDGIDRLIRRGADHLLVSHADLPRPGRLLDVVSAERVTLVPDRRRDGTNVMSFPARARLRASYGAGSFRRHLAQAQELGTVPVEVRPDPELSLDLDTLADLTHPLVQEVLPSWLTTIPASRA